MPRRCSSARKAGGSGKSDGSHEYPVQPLPKRGGTESTRCQSMSTTATEKGRRSSANRSRSASVRLVRVRVVAAPPVPERPPGQARRWSRHRVERPEGLVVVAAVREHLHVAATRHAAADPPVVLEQERVAVVERDDPVARQDTGLERHPPVHVVERPAGAAEVAGSWPQRHRFASAPEVSTTSPVAENGRPSYRRVARSVVTSTPSPRRTTVYSGTGRRRRTAKVEARSSKPPSSLHSMRKSPSHSTVIRQWSPCTTASPSATGSEPGKGRMVGRGPSVGECTSVRSCLGRSGRCRYGRLGSALDGALRHAADHPALREQVDDDRRAIAMRYEANATL